MAEKIYFNIFLTFYSPCCDSEHKKSCGEQKYGNEEKGKENHYENCGATERQKTVLLVNRENENIIND